MSESSLSLSKVTCPRTRVMFHQKLSQANHVRRMMAARMKDDGNIPSFTLPSHQLNNSKKIQDSNDEGIAFTKLKFGRQRSQSSDSYRGTTRQMNYMQGKKVSSQDKQNVVANKWNNFFGRREIPSQGELLKTVRFHGKNVINSNERSSSKFSKIPPDKSRKKSIFSENTTPITKFEECGKFQKQTIKGDNLIAKSVQPTKCPKRNVQVKSANQILKGSFNNKNVCLSDKGIQNDISGRFSAKENSETNHSNSYHKGDLNSSITKSANVKKPELTEFHKNLDFLKPAKDGTLNNENKIGKKYIPILQTSETNLPKGKTQTKIKCTETKRPTLTGVAEKKTDLLKTKKEANIYSSKTTMHSDDFKTTYSSLSETSMYRDDLKTTLEGNVTHEKDKELFLSTKKATATNNLEKLPENTFPAKIKLRQIPVLEKQQVASKIPLRMQVAEDTPSRTIKSTDQNPKFNSTYFDLKVAKDKIPVIVFTKRMCSKDPQELTEQNSSQNQSQKDRHLSSKIPLACEKLRSSKQTFEFMENSKSDPSRNISEASVKYVVSRAKADDSGSFCIADNADGKVSSWLKNLQGKTELNSEDKSNTDGKLNINTGDDSDTNRWNSHSTTMRGCSKKRSASSSKIPPSYKNPNRNATGKSRILSSPSLPAGYQHVKNRKSVVDSDMLMGKLNDPVTEKEFFEAPIQKFMDVINSAFLDIESDEEI